ncbi:hypothetical protein TcYC6_0070190 [Trypanosoma cruzi]|nr:hypothetical protein TcYC6_0070190 [Trypanosoma cruzi]
MNGPPRRHSRCPDDTDNLFLRRRVCVETPSFMDGVNSVERRGGLSEAEWRQLYERVMPNACTMSDFQRLVLEGKSHDHFFAKDLHKLVMEVRVILATHGKLRMAANLAVKGRKTVLAHGVATALNLLESERSHLFSEDICGKEVNGRGGSSCNVSSRAPEQTAVEPVNSATVLHSSTSSTDLLRTHQPSRCNTRTLDQPPLRAGVGEVCAEPSVSEHGKDEEVLLMNNSSSPFTRVLSVVKRFQLRFGSIPLRFEVPIEFLDAVVSRRLRVQLTPFRHPAVPARWPTAKDIVVYVNDQCVMTPWKRSWPERRMEVAKTFLVLDITQFLNRGSAFQRLQINVFSREYFSQVALMIVQPVTPEEVINGLVRPLCRPQEETRDAAIFDLYRKVVEDDDEDAILGEVEVDDPVITSKCPILQTRINIPVRGSRCQHLQCFDCLSFLLSCNKGCYWNCPLCDAELRPCDMVVDTILWRYLQEVGDGCPLHLRLKSKRNMEKERIQKRDDAVEGVMAAPFRWVPHRMASDGHDVILDDHENDDCDSNDGGAMGPKRQLSGCFRTGVNGGRAFEKGGEMYGGKGLDETNADLDKQLGTAEFPIEL